jgi:hypothetical protein
MKPGAQKVVDDAANRQVPQEMLEKLSKADDRLHETRAGLDAANAGMEIGHTNDVHDATDRVREAERDVEAASDAIRQKLNESTKPSETK